MSEVVRGLVAGLCWAMIIGLVWVWIILLSSPAVQIWERVRWGRRPLRPRGSSPGRAPTDGRRRPPVRMTPAASTVRGERSELVG